MMIQIILQLFQQLNFESANHLLTAITPWTLSAYKNPRNGGTLLHSLCRVNYEDIITIIGDEYVTNVDNNGDLEVPDKAVELARILIDNSLYDKKRENILNVKDSNGNTPLHLICGNVSGQFIPASFLYLILDHYHCRGYCISLRNLLIAKNSHGLTPLHILFDSLGYSSTLLKYVMSLIQKEGELSGLITDYYLQAGEALDFKDGKHPMLLADNDGDLPIHYFCSHWWDEPERLRAILDCDGFMSRLNQKSLFCIGYDSILPVMHIFYSFATEYEDILDYWSNLVEFGDEPRFPVDDFLNFMLNCDEEELIWDTGVDTGMIMCLIKTSLWPRLEILIKCASQNNNAMSPIHLASAIPSFPSSVLKAAHLATSEPQFLVHDKCGSIPLHIAASSKPRDLLTCTRAKRIIRVSPKKREAADANSLWQSKGEPRSLIQYLVDQEPKAVQITDSDGRLPIHLGIKTNLNFASSIKPLVDIYPLGLSTADPITRLYPFMLAAVHENLDTTFELLIANPVVCKKNSNDKMMEGTPNKKIKLE